MFKLNIVGKISKERSKEEIKLEAETVRWMFEDYEEVKMKILEN